jgi:hypothetical protein
MSRLSKYLVSLCVSFFAFCLVCAGQAVDYSQFERDYYSLKKTYPFPGKSISDLSDMVCDWDLERAGLEYWRNISYKASGRDYHLTLRDVPVDGTDVNILGSIAFFFRDGELEVAFWHIGAGWRHKAVIFLPAPGVSDGYIENMSKRNKRTLSCIYSKTEEIFSEVCDYIDVKVGESKNVTLKDFGMVPVE